MAHSYGSLVYSVALKKKKIYFKLCVWMYDCVRAVHYERQSVVVTGRVYDWPVMYVFYYMLHLEKTEQALGPLLSVLTGI